MNDFVNVSRECETVFAKSITDSFRTPLKKSLELLREPNFQEHQEELYRELSKIDKNIQNILLLSDIRQGKRSSESRIHNTIEFFETVTFAHFDAAIQQGVDYYIYIDPSLPKNIEIFEEDIQFILNTLIENGIKYTPKGGNVYVDIRVFKRNKESIELQYSVSDTGVGIAKESVKKILQPFATQNSEGLGIALASCYHLLKYYNSPLKIASQEDKGSRFSFTLEHNTSNEPSFQIFPDYKIGVYVEERQLFGYSKVLYQYLIALGLCVTSIKGLDDSSILECQVVFIVSNKNSSLEYLNKRYAAIRFVNTMLYEKNSKLNRSKMLLFPTSLISLNKVINNVHSDVPYALLKSNEDDMLAMQHLAEEAKSEKITILAVEDNPINLKLLQVILRRYDFTVETAENGQIAVDMCKRKKYNLILMDIDMPVMDGITATNLIKEFEKIEGIEQTPIVALTSHDLVGEREDIMSNGLDEHMPKPLNVGRLELMLERYIGFKQ